MIKYRVKMTPVNLISTQLQTDYILVVNYKTFIVIKIQLWYHIRN